MNSNFFLVILHFHIVFGGSFKFLKLKRIEYLDSVRGLAALSVIAGHFIASYGLPQMIAFFSKTPLALFINGAGAVSLFFILSGYVLSIKFFSKDWQLETTSFSFLQFSISRIFRIYPLFFAALLISYFARNYLDTSFITIPQETSYSNRLWSQLYPIKRFILESLLIIRIPKDAGLRLLPQDWSLTIEILLSICVPFLALFCRWRPGTFIGFSIFSLYFLRVHPSFFEFILGVSLAYYTPILMTKWISINKISKMIFLLTGIILYTSAYTFPSILIRYLDLTFFNITSWGSFIILAFVICSEKTQKILNHSVLRFFGKISFGLYLFHYMIILAIVPFFIKYLNMAGLNDIPAVKILSFCFVIASTCILSYIMYYLVEKTFIKMGKNVNSLLSSKI